MGKLNFPICLRGEQSKYRTDGNHIFDYRHSQVIINYRQRCVLVLKNSTPILIDRSFRVIGFHTKNHFKVTYLIVVRPH